MSGRFSEGTRHQPVTATEYGLMSPADYAKLAAYPAYADLDLPGVSALVSHNANQSIANNTLTVVAFNTDNLDTYGYHDPATNNSRLTVPDGLAGIHVAVAKVIWDTSTTGDHFAGIYNQAGTLLGSARWKSDGAAATVNQQSVTSVPVALTQGDYLYLQVQQITGGALNLLSLTLFGLIRLGSN